MRGGVQQENSLPNCFLIRFTVEHQMRVARLENGEIDAAQEAQQFIRPPLVVCGQTTAGQWGAWHAFARCPAGHRGTRCPERDDHAGFDIERCEQRGRAVALLWLPPVMQEPSDRLVACDRVRTSIRPRCAAFPEAAGRDGDLRIRSKSCKRACGLEAPHWFFRSRSVRSFRPFRSSSSHTPLGTVAG